MYDKQKMQDIRFSELPLINEYQTRFNNRDIPSMSELTSGTLKYKILNAYNWNRLINSINDSNIVQNWDSATAYKFYDLATYSGYVYINLQENGTNINKQPDTNDEWFRLYETPATIQATTNSILGIWQSLYNELVTQSADFVDEGIWMVGTTYKKNNCVKYGDNVYYCIQTHISTSSITPNDTSCWVRVKNVRIPLYEPVNKTEINVWFEVIE